MIKTTMIAAASLIVFGTSAGADERAPILLDDAQLDALTAAGAPDNPGQAGQTNAFMTAGFQGVLEKKGLVAATYLFGNKGKGNGADPDPLGLASDHDPGVVGGAPDMYR